MQDEPIKAPSLIVIPAYNERRRLPSLIDEAGEHLQRRSDLHVLVADDGSDPEEARAVEEHVALTRSHNGLSSVALGYVHHPHNRGKGAVVRDAFLAQAESAAYAIQGFLDADGSTPFSEAVRLIDLLRENRDLWDGVLGCRLKCLGIPVERRLSRHLVGRVFATMVSTLFDIPVYDSQCGAKFFKSTFLTHDLLQLCNDDRWLFDTQLVIALWREGVRLRECPVLWREIHGSKVSLVLDPARMFLGLVQFKRRLESWERRTHDRGRSAS